MCFGTYQVLLGAQELEVIAIFVGVTIKASADLFLCTVRMAEVLVSSVNAI